MTITGPATNVPYAAALVQELIDQPQQPTGAAAAGAERMMLDVPADLVGRVIGRGGETIKSLQHMSGAHIDIDQNYPPGEPRKVTITGSKAQIEAAHQALLSVMRDGPNSAVTQATGAFTQVIDVDASVVGRLIGRGGATINDMQARSKCRIQIDQSTPEGMPKKVSVSGAHAENVAMAVQIIQDVIQGGDGRGGGGGYGMQQGGYGMQQGGYGMMPQMGYGGVPQGAYGGMQQQAYGQQAYGGYRAGGQGYGGYQPVVRFLACPTIRTPSMMGVWD